MNGILIIDKKEGYTSRDVVNKISKLLDTKKIGHTGTLDPLATGVLVLCIGKATKLSEIITGYEKEYEASITLGRETDTYDCTGHILKEENVDFTKEQIEEALLFFTKTYSQEVPIYAAVKINGKKLYEYAREKKQVVLPRRDVTIYHLQLISDVVNQKGKTTFQIKCKVSKGTYIRSLIHDIAFYLGTVGTMDALRRTKQGNFSLQDAYAMEDVEQGNYAMKPILSVFENYPQIKVDESLKEKIKNGSLLPSIYHESVILFLDQNGIPLALYKEYEKDSSLLKPWKMLYTRKE